MSIEKKEDQVFESLDGMWGIIDPEIHEYIVDTIDVFSFGEALKLLKIGKSLGRKGWDEEGKFLTLKFGEISHPSRMIGNNYIREFMDSKLDGKINIENTFLLKTSKNTLVYWIPSYADLLAEDWREVII